MPLAQPVALSELGDATLDEVSLGNERGRILLQRYTSAEVAFRKMLASLRAWSDKTGGQLTADLVERIGVCRVKLAALEELFGG
ncbi:MAG: hypothetical protein HC784_04890 [Hydrococcus sp. CSU_1_8]|nr:hypothetical protein [Hydrococcus sp. CSU_1_8]